MRKTACVLLLLGIFLGTATAADGPDMAAVRAEIKEFRKHFADEDMNVRMEALRSLAETRHPLAIDEIGKRVLPHEDPEVRMAGALILARVSADPVVAGPYLRDLLGKNDDYPEVQVEFIRAIRAIDYRGAHQELTAAAMRFLERDYRFVVSEVMTTFGAQKDVMALPFMLKLVEYNTAVAKGKRGPSIRTGSSMSQAKRREMWMALYRGKMMPGDRPGFVTKWWLQELVLAVKEITGKEFTDRFAFRNWLTVHRRELKIKLSALDRKRKLKPPKPKPRPEEAEGD
jgi:hypothetical protein